MYIYVNTVLYITHNYNDTVLLSGMQVFTTSIGSQITNRSIFYH